MAAKTNGTANKLNGSTPATTEAWAWSSKRRLRVLLELKFRAKNGDLLQTHDQPIERDFDVPEGAKGDWLVKLTPVVRWHGQAFHIPLEIPLGKIKADSFFRFPVDLPCRPREVSQVTFSDGGTAIKAMY